MPPRSAREVVDQVHERGQQAATPRPQGFQSGRGGNPLNIGGRRDDGGLENADQKQLDRELAAAVGRQERSGLPDKPDAGGGAKLDKGTSLSDNNVSADDSGHTASSSSGGADDSGHTASSSSHHH